MGGNKPQNVTYHPRKEAHQVKLDHMLDFGVDSSSDTGTQKSANETTERLSQLLKKLQELNQRVDALHSRY